MKLQVLLIAYSILSFSFLYAQEDNEIEKIVLQGIEAHDKQEYSQAINIYKKALLLDSLSPLVNYEMALSYYAMQDYKKAIQYSDVVFLTENDMHSLAYLVKGSSLSDLEEFEAALKTFNQALKIDSTYYLNHFNIGLIHLKMNNKNNAEKSFFEALKDNPAHSSSHYYLTMNSINKEMKIPALLSAYFFLLLEPNTLRAQETLTIIHYLFDENVSKDDKGAININYRAQDDNAPFKAAELFLGLAVAKKHTNNDENSSEEEHFCSITTDLFTVLSELVKTDTESDFWHEFYISFYEKLTHSNHMTTFCEYITLSQYSEEEKDKWYEENNEKIQNFSIWLEENF